MNIKSNRLSIADKCVNGKKRVEECDITQHSAYQYVPVNIYRFEFLQLLSMDMWTLERCMSFKCTRPFNVYTAIKSINII